MQPIDRESARIAVTFFLSPVRNERELRARARLLYYGLPTALGSVYEGIEDERRETGKYPSIDDLMHLYAIIDPHPGEDDIDPYPDLRELGERIGQILLAD